MRLRYTIELGINCLVIGDLDESVTSFQDRFRVLERYQTGWDSISYNRREKENVALTDARFLANQFCRWNWVCYEEDVDSRSKIVLSRLPSTLRGITESLIVSHQLDFQLASFAIDPFNNLLVFTQRW